MSVPDWWQAALLALAAWRTFQLVAEDDILNRPRAVIFGWLGNDTPRAGRFADFIQCPYCLGFWVALAWWGAWQVWEQGTLVAATPLALSAGVVAVHRLLSED